MINFIEKIRIKRNLRKALKEVKLAEQDKIKLQTWDELLEELKGDENV